MATRASPTVECVIEPGLAWDCCDSEGSRSLQLLYALRKALDDLPGFGVSLALLFKLVSEEQFRMGLLFNALVSCRRRRSWGNRC